MAETRFMPYNSDQFGCHFEHGPHLEALIPGIPGMEQENDVEEKPITC